MTLKTLRAPQAQGFFSFSIGPTNPLLASASARLAAAALAASCASVLFDNITVTRLRMPANTLLDVPFSVFSRSFSMSFVAGASPDLLSVVLMRAISARKTLRWSKMMTRGLRPRTVGYGVYTTSARCASIWMGEIVRSPDTTGTSRSALPKSDAYCCIKRTLQRSGNGMPSSTETTTAQGDSACIVGSVGSSCRPRCATTS